MKDGMIGAVQAVGAVLLEVFNKPIVAMQSGLEYAMQSMMEMMPKRLQDMLGVEAGPHQSLEDITARRTQEKATIYGKDAEGLAMGADARMASAAAALKELGGKFDLRGKLDEVITAFKEGYQSGKLLDEDTPKQKLKELWDKLQSAIPKDAKTRGSDKGQAAGGVGGMNAAMQGADRFSKVGMFVGGGGPENNYARETAGNTTKMVSILNQHTKLLTGHPTTGNTEATWGAA